MKFIFTRIETLIVVLIIGFLTILNTAEASVISYTKDQDGVTFTLDKGLMKVKICKDDIIEVKYTALTSLQAKSSLIINNTWAVLHYLILSKTRIKSLFQRRE